MPAILVNSSQGYVGSGQSQLAWNHTIPSLGLNALIIACFMGREQTGDQNPEEVHSATFNGVSMTPLIDQGSQETGGAMFALQGSNIPAAGTYEVRGFYSGSGTAEFHRGVIAVFRRVRNQAREAINANTGNQGGRKQVSLTTLTPNALVIASHWWRVGFAETQYSDFTPIEINRGDNSAGQSLYYKNVQLPGLVTFDIDAGNTEDQSLQIACFETQKPGGGFLTHFL